jgi:hypothetical protein
MNNKKVFLKKVKKVIKETGYEENIMYTTLMLRMSAETIDDLQSMKGEINDLCNFLNGEETFDELYMGAMVFILEGFLDLTIELNEGNDTRIALLTCVKEGVVFIKALFKECIDDDTWHQLLVKQAVANTMFLSEKVKIDSTFNAA